MHNGQDSRTQQLVAAVDAMLGALAEQAEQLGTQPHRVAKVAQECLTLLHAPPTILVSGRMKSGKSTLINALVRQKIADTAILECTNAVTIYTKGAPERIEPLALPGPEDSVKVHFLPSRALSAFNFVDTPGLGTVDARNLRIVKSLRELRHAPWNPHGHTIDGLIYVFDSTLREDEVAHIRSLGFSSLASVGVLARADDFASGAFGSEDPIEAARARAAELTADYAHYFSSVTAVSGLLAESAETGRITESLAVELRGLDGWDRETLMHEMETEDPQSMNPDSRRQLLETLGAYGVLEGRRAARCGAVGLQSFYREASGVVTLAAHLGESISYATALGRCAVVHQKLKDLAFSMDAIAVLDYWDEYLAVEQRLAVAIYGLLGQAPAPGSRVSQEGLALAEEVLQLRAGEHGARAVEIHELVSGKLLGLLSPLEEKLLGSVSALSRQLSR